MRQVLLPVVFFCQHNRYQFLGTDNTVTMLTPELLITFQPVCIVLYRICFSITLTAIERNQCR
uniref:Uncharacterized protein n=1 Tax=Escherichia coli TaxID=562 RepID=A1YN38_ECOLX|nr:hypothetical protein ECf0014 [Escherichia coli]